MANWTSINDVIRDLSVAQGSVVPASLEIYGNTPPNFNIDEDSVHDLKSQGDVNFVTKAPDFSYIQKMISMVTANKDKEKLEFSRSKLNPLSPEFIPQNKRQMEILWKTKVARNVALMSILDKLEKKADKSPNISESPSSMFRKKRVASVEKKSTISKEKSDITSKSQYTPSIIANEYYNKYIENNKLRDQNKKDIVEPVREIYVKRDQASQKKFLYYYSSLYCNEETTEKGTEYMLESHRHLSIDNVEDCVVCSIIDKHGYSFKEDNNIKIGPWGDGFILKHVASPTLSDDNIIEDNSEGS